jgi:hypothetical protein
VVDACATTSGADVAAGTTATGAASSLAADGEWQEAQRTKSTRDGRQAAKPFSRFIGVEATG